MSRPVDNKVHVRRELDLSTATWTKTLPEGVTVEDAVEYAHVRHSDGITYTVVRQPSNPDGQPLVFTPSEWDAFAKGVQAGEFDLPA
ncbi:DUF397 domain-containing protein [Amycolatopsis sp. cmx-11-12]|uniref:DUF397 domain-containing protein n=1 Tax=Amycolatopsis sp. cmx-11-12 TaxID=2785795 RepID=UPI0039181B98